MKDCYSWLLFMVFSKKIEKHVRDRLTKGHAATTEGSLAVLSFQLTEDTPGRHQRRYMKSAW